MCLVAAIRQFLLGLAVLGLLLAPTAGSMRRAMASGPMVGMTQCTPDCPENPPNDCPKCALMATCAFHCLDIFALEPTFVVSFEHGSASILPDAPQIVAGIDHPPKPKPPRA